MPLPHHLLSLQLLICERALLQTLGFSLNVDHIHRHLKTALKRLFDASEPKPGARVAGVRPMPPLPPTERRQLATVAENMVSLLPDVHDVAPIPVSHSSTGESAHPTTLSRWDTGRASDAPSAPHRAPRACHGGREHGEFIAMT